MDGAQRIAEHSRDGVVGRKQADARKGSRRTVENISLAAVAEEIGYGRLR